MKRPPESQQELIEMVPFVSIPTNLLGQVLEIIARPVVLREMSAMALVDLATDAKRYIDAAWDQALARKISEEQSATPSSN